MKQAQGISGWQLAQAPAWLRYSLAFLTFMVTAALTNWQPAILYGSPYALFFAAVIGVALVAGTGEALLVMLLSVPVVQWLRFGTNWEEHLSAPELVRLTVFCGVSSLLLLLLRQQQRASLLLKSKERFQRLFETNLLGLAFFDTTGQMLHANDTLLKMLGYSRAELEAGEINMAKLNPPEWQERSQQMLAQPRVGPPISPFEKEYLHKNGQRIPVLVTGVLFPEQPNEGVAIVLDLSELRRAEKQLRESEALLAQAVKLAGLGIFQYDAAVNELYWSPSLREMFGYEATTPATLEGYAKLIHPEERAQVLAAVQAAHDPAGSGEYKAVHRIVRQDGALRWLSLQSQSFFKEVNGERQLHQVIGTARDITERKLAEERLRLFERTVTAMHESVLITDTETSATDGPHIIYVNPALCAMTGYRAEELIGRTPRLLQGPGTEQRELNKLRLALREGRAVNAELTNYRKDGSTLTVALNLQPVTDESGALTHWISVRQDVTEQRAAEADLRLLLALGERIRLSENADELLTECVQLLGKHLRVERCFFARVRLEQNNFTILPDYYCTGQSLAGTHPLDAFNLAITEDAAQGHALVVHDTATDARTKDFPDYQQYGFGALMAVGQFRAGTLHHSLNVTTAQPRTWQPREVALFETVAERIWNASEKLRLATELRRSKARLLLAQEISNAATFEWDIRTNEVVWSRTHFTMLGLEPDSVQPSYEHWRERLHPDDVAAVETRLQQTLASGVKLLLEYRIVQPTGRCLWVSTHGHTEYDADGQPRRMIGLMIDITERKEAELELERRALALERLNASLQRSNAELDAFTYIASHDLKEPLRGLRNYAQMLSEDYAQQLDDTGNQYLQTLGRLAERMQTMTDSLLQYSRLGRQELQLREIEVQEVVQDTLLLLAPRLQAAQAEVRCAQNFPRLHADPYNLSEIFTNLLTNALKYNDKPQPLLEIGWQPGAAPNEPPVFFVRDNGIGIPAKHQETVFQIFKRLHGRDDFGGGTGAGLTIVRKLVERHGGRIWFESEVGQGTTFYFTLATTKTYLSLEQESALSSRTTLD